MSDGENLQLAVQAARCGERARARSLFREVLRQDPTSFTAWLWLSEVADSLEEQTAALERAMALCPENTRGHRDLQRHLNELRSPANPPANAVAEPAAQEPALPEPVPAPLETGFAAVELSALPKPDSYGAPPPAGRAPGDQFFLAERLSIMGKPAEAIRLLTSLAATNPGDLRLWLLLSELQTDPAEKVRALQKVLELEPNHAEAARRLAALNPVVESPLMRGKHLEEAGNYAEATRLYRSVIALSSSPTERVEATQRIANIEQRQEADQVQPIHPTLNLLRVGVGPALLFIMMALLQCGFNLLHLSVLDVLSLFSVLGGGLLIAATGMRPMHPKWIELYGEPGSAAELSQRRKLRRAGWLLMLAPFTIFLIEASFRLGALQASMMENFR